MFIYLEQHKKNQFFDIPIDIKILLFYSFGLPLSRVAPYLQFVTKNCLIVAYVYDVICQLVNEDTVYLSKEQHVNTMLFLITKASRFRNFSFIMSL